MGADPGDEDHPPLVVEVHVDAQAAVLAHADAEGDMGTAEHPLSLVVEGVLVCGEVQGVL